MTTQKFHNKYRIPSVRATFHNYNGGSYFITICTKNRAQYFGKIIRSDAGKPTMQLTETGKFADENLRNITTHYPYANIPLFVVMPDHIHMIILISGRDVARNVSTGPVPDNVAPNVSTDNVPSNVSTGNVPSNVSTEKSKNKKMVEIAEHQSLLTATIRGFKSAVTKFANETNFEFAWQTRFHDHIIRDRDELNRIADYIERNINNWDAVESNPEGNDIQQ